MEGAHDRLRIHARPPTRPQGRRLGGPGRAGGDSRPRDRRLLRADVHRAPPGAYERAGQRHDVDRPYRRHPGAGAGRRCRRWRHRPVPGRSRRTRLRGDRRDTWTAATPDRGGRGVSPTDQRHRNRRRWWIRKGRGQSGLPQHGDDQSQPRRVRWWGVSDPARQHPGDRCGRWWRWRRLRHERSVHRDAGPRWQRTRQRIRRDRDCQRLHHERPGSWRTGRNQRHGRHRWPRRYVAVASGTTENARNLVVGNSGGAGFKPPVGTECRARRR